ncbi:Upf3p [Kluyveromyces lactis]|uniref:KLLA0D03718p n=1 Tax=Kluyveromyces lactis (strain ATCC 8585 / CBS 2359 / DSM 70799 / NBRC 1267 / NRRL Y-1140 / WM37) TaxID=284590 RepID=Q6CS59_KLULA|nr:uncharacterized protein KLLA0_D03718g [Kluyveromyces lactis]CAH00326.1 KLLA0D03718p [Kluyveromyces lactis]|eukprot:XP_453230.1 uncharacterized protein KLLA0_D03718g [Kluyveromyces lactis]
MLSKKRNRRRYRKRSADSSREFKLCIRSLPPNLTEEQFISTLQENNIDVHSFQKSFYYVQGHYSSKVFKKQTLSRAYIQLDSFETIQSLSKTIRTCRFIDDLDNSMIPDLQISPFVKKWVSPNEVNPIQGTIQKDHVFQTFVKSWKLINEDETNSLQFKNLSVIAPLRKELEREEKMEEELNGRKQRALIELAGDPTSEEKKKRIKKIKKKLRLLEKKRKLKRAKAKNKDNPDEKDVSKDKSEVEKPKKSKSKHKSKSKSKPKSKSEPKSSKFDTATTEKSAVTSEEKPKKKILLKPKKDDVPKPEMPADSEVTKRARRKKSKKHKDKDKDVKKDLTSKETKETPSKVTPKVKIKSKSANVEEMKSEKRKQENTKPEKNPSSESDKKAKSKRKSRKGRQSDGPKHKDKPT